MKRFVVVILLIVLFLSSCTTSRGVVNHSPVSIPIAEQNIEIVDYVKLTYTTHGVLGILPEISLIRWGRTNSYAALLEEAKKLGAHDVVNIKVDHTSTSISIFYNRREWVAVGLAIRYLD